MSAYLKGVFSDITDMNAKFTTGHVKILTRAYAENEEQVPNDLALIDTKKLIAELQSEYPYMEWVERIIPGHIGCSGFYR